jgi:hypothetical protein
MFAGCIIVDDTSDVPPTVTQVEPAPVPPQRAEPLLAKVDTDKTMNAKGGDGVGVFVEYGSGGKWRVWWTCDTSRTGQSCAFSHEITGSQIKGVQAVGVSQSNAVDKGIAATAVTTDGVGELTFEAAPGAPITVTSRLSGADNSDGRFFFFVQDGRVNGGYAGVLSNPLSFQGTQP